jgi:ribosomal protein S18 acetylase RimI-like enzyme
LKFVPRWTARIIRSYVAWQERRVKNISIEMCLTDLQAWRGEPRIPGEFEIVPLPQCGDEWLLRRIYNEAASDSIGFRFARVLDIIAFGAAPTYDPGGVFLIRSKNRYVGTCVVRARLDGTGGLYSMSVHPDFRRKGIARALLRHSLLHLQSRGLGRVHLWAHPNNERAISLYLTEGFEVVRPLEPDLPEPRWDARHNTTGSPDRRCERAAQSCLSV